ncbi:hypothetical protein, partial [Escherichia coli]|uniref:hypothetical protein n=1 Tax=Escherichia coli TaxID=562 RepID=UPI00142E3892
VRMEISSTDDIEKDKHVEDLKQNEEKEKLRSNVDCKEVYDASDEFLLDPKTKKKPNQREHIRAKKLKKELLKLRNEKHIQLEL